MHHLLLPIFLVACVPTDPPKPLDTSAETVPDTGWISPEPCDDDGYGPSDGDCDECNSEVHPGATELCDGLDNNCDGVIDEDVQGTYYADADGDGFGDASRTAQACEAPRGYVQNADDCDDVNVGAYPGAVEVCDLMDNDCDGSVDEDATGRSWIDADGDGFGDPSAPLATCASPPDSVDNPDDCDDLDPAVNPASAEVCNTLDDDCDGAIDETGVCP